MKKTVLIIDDNTEILEFVTDILEDNYHVLTAIDGESGINLLTNHLVHLIISDVMMPGIDGFQLCQTLKEDLAYCHIPVILLTAKNTFKAQIEGLEKGADAYIKKPFSPTLLQVQVANLLKNRSKIKEHTAHAPFFDIHIESSSKSDEEFLKEIDHYIQSNLSNKTISIDQLAAHMNMSRPTFYRKINSLSSISPKELIDQARLKKATDLMAQGQYKIYEIAHMTGYSSQSVFGKTFQKYFNQSPKEYIHAMKNKL